MVRETRWSRLLGPAACLVLVLVFFGSVLFHDEQLSFRDAGHYYYPLHKLVQREWDAGRWPLWEPEENSGMPLMGNPTAAVLYPGKIVFALAPYPIAAKLYIVGHVAAAFATMTLALRWWGLSRAAAAGGAVSYAFGAPILFQYCNVIFLVGAAWLPLGVRAADRWLRFGIRWGLLELAVVLALLAMGGDPETAYLLGFAAAVYAVQLVWTGTRGEPDLRSSHGAARFKGAAPRGRAWKIRLAAGLVVSVWIVATLVLARVLPHLRPNGMPTPPLPWMRWSPYVVAAGWVGLTAAWCIRTRDRTRRRLLLTMMVGLIGSAVLAAGLSAAQILPIAEFTAQTNRAAEGGPHDIYPFSLEPMFLAQFVWPNVFGTPFPDNSFWAEPLDWASFRRTVWVPSLYIGGMSLLLALSAFGFRNGPPWRAWLSGVVIFSLLGSFGQFTSPIWFTRVIDRALKPEAEEAMRRGTYKGMDTLLGIGPIDRTDVNPLRQDGYLRDGDGGFYWALATFLPGFRQFRYPSKMLTFVCFGLCALAGLGWERIIQGDRRRIQRLAHGLAAITVILLLAVLISRDRFVKTFGERGGGSQWGPFDSELAYRGLAASLTQTVVLLVLGLAIVRLAAKRPALAGALVVSLTAADLALANSRLILTSPQSLYETVPETLQHIRDAERKDPADGPYRIHRMALWNPLSWNQNMSNNRVAEYTRWERDTLQPKYGLTEGVEYTQTIGVTELYDYEWFFGPFTRKARPEVAEAFQIPVGTEIVYYPRRAFDMWNSRYFITPQFPNHWTDGARGFASFLTDVDRIHPAPNEFNGPGGEERIKKWVETKDYQIFRNLAAYPRAWIVHDYRPTKPLSGLNRDNREGAMYEMVYANDLIWKDPERRVFNPREVAWISEDEVGSLQNFRGRPPRGTDEHVTVHYPSPQQAVLECNLETPGMVILSDVYYPGWKLTIDGEPAPIHRANQLMRGAAVGAGKHTLVYSYDPGSFRIGLASSAAAILIAAAAAVAIALRPVCAVVAGARTT